MQISQFKFLNIYNNKINKHICKMPYTPNMNKACSGASLVVQWLRILLPGALVQALVREDPTCHGATKPVCRNY